MTQIYIAMLVWDKILSVLLVFLILILLKMFLLLASNIFIINILDYLVIFNIKVNYIAILLNF